MQFDTFSPSNKGTFTPKKLIATYLVSTTEHWVAHLCPWEYMSYFCELLWVQSEWLHIDSLQGHWPLGWPARTEDRTPLVWSLTRKHLSVFSATVESRHGEMGCSVEGAGFRESRPDAPARPRSPALSLYWQHPLTSMPISATFFGTSEFLGKFIFRIWLVRSAESFSLSEHQQSAWAAVRVSHHLLDPASVRPARPQRLRAGGLLASPLGVWPGFSRCGTLWIY